MFQRRALLLERVQQYSVTVVETIQDSYLRPSSLPQFPQAAPDGFCIRHRQRMTVLLQQANETIYVRTHIDIKRINEFLDRRENYDFSCHRKSARNERPRSFQDFITRKARIDSCAPVSLSLSALSKAVVPSGVGQKDHLTVTLLAILRGLSTLLPSSTAM